MSQYIAQRDRHGQAGELRTRNPEMAKRFWKELFDWKYEDLPEMDYTIIKLGEGAGGMMNTVHTCRNSSMQVTFRGVPPYSQQQ